MLHRAASYCALLVALLSASSVPAQSLEDLLKGSDGLLAPTTAPEEDPEVSVTLHPITGQPQHLLLAVRVELPDGAYTYSQDPAFLGHSAIEVARINGAKPIDDRFLPDHAPKRAYDEIFEQDIEKFTNEVTWYRRFQMTDGVAPGDVEIVGELRYQVCKNTCRQFKHPVHRESVGRISRTSGGIRRSSSCRSCHRRRRIRIRVPHRSDPQGRR